MTGFARAEGEVSGMKVAVEAKSVNHKYLELKFHLPREVQALEGKITELCRGFMSRGRVDVYVLFQAGQVPVAVEWNRPLAEGMARALAEMKDALDLDGRPDLSLLASQRDVIVIGQSASWGEESWPSLARICGDCFRALAEMRSREGAALAADILGRLAAIEERLDKLADKAPAVVSLYRDKLEKRVKELMGGQVPVNGERLAQELSLFADRADITEELVRARSHLDQFRDALNEDGPKGRKLDFLIQEIFREINTTSNKVQDAGLSGLAVEIKTELEKIREQAQNLE